MANRIDQLKAEMARLEEELKRESGKMEARVKLTDLARELGYEIHELFEPEDVTPRRIRPHRDAANKERRDAPPIKYRRGDETWSGLGRRPKWIAELVDAGEDIEQFRVTD